MRTYRHVLALVGASAISLTSCGAGSDGSPRNAPGNNAGGASGSAGASAVAGNAGAPASGGTGGAAGSAAIAGNSGSGGSGGSGLGGAPSNGFFPTTVTSVQADAAYASWKTGFLENCGANGYRVRWDDPNKTVSEGIGYGALLTASYGDKAEFDGIWTYYQKAAQASDAQKGTAKGLMGWITNGCALVVEDPGAAADGDLDMAMGLILAECRWGGGAYGASATTLVNAIQTHMTKEVGPLTTLLPGDNWGTNTFCMNPSYFAPAYYRVFAEQVPAQAAFWNKFATDSYTSLNQVSHATTGLPPEWAPNGSGGCSMGDQGRYGYNAARTPWRIATDYVWFGTPEAKTWLDKVTNWVMTGPTIGLVKDGFSTDGSDATGSGISNSTFVGGFAVGAMAHSQAASDSFHQTFLSVPADKDSNYFQATLRVVYLLLSTQRFVPGCQ
jgi:endo-1,4-beta-D-glucanase Y